MTKLPMRRGRNSNGGSAGNGDGTGGSPVVVRTTTGPQGMPSSTSPRGSMSPPAATFWPDPMKKTPRAQVKLSTKRAGITKMNAC